MNVRLIIAIVSTIVEMVLLAVAALYGLPQIGIEVSAGGLIALLALWLVFSVIIYLLGSSALRRKPVAQLPGMVGMSGEAVQPLAPEGMVRLRNELWSARAEEGRIEPGEKVIVLSQSGLKLVVRRVR